jgi:hypothetical protein
MTMDTERLLERLAAADADRASEPAPARLKARIYSRLINRLSETGRLLSLTATKAGGAGLCVFEETLAALPLGDEIRSMNPCRVCHARVLAERLERAPIFWPHCPYSEFHHGPKD